MRALLLTAASQAAAELERLEVENADLRARLARFEADALAPQRTLLFCTSFHDTPRGWTQRHRRWLDAVRRSRLHHDQALIVDDGSSCLPDWPDLRVVERVEDNGDGAPLVLLHFPDNLGRPSVHDFPGWYRSFAAAAEYAMRHGFEKVVHIESDAFAISPRFVAYLESINDGWVAMWCGLHLMPELALWVAAGDGVRLFYESTRRPHTAIVGRSYEHCFPFTHVDRRYRGDRFNHCEVPRNVDFATQVDTGLPAEHYWWLPA